MERFHADTALFLVRIVGLRLDHSAGSGIAKDQRRRNDLDPRRSRKERRP
jgi:hypothetical protein